MKKLIIPFIVFGFVAAFLLIKHTQRKNSIYSIGILKTTSHSALDEAEKGFIEELKKLMHDDIGFIIKNGQGSITSIHTIAQQFHSNKQIDAFLAIATPAAQALSSVEKERPIIIAAVTDPISLGLIHPKTNVCGTKDMIDIKAQIEMLVQLIPNAKTVGLLYTNTETNSLVSAQLMRDELSRQGLIPLDFTVSNESDIPAVVELACRKSDVILAPNDNTISSAITLVTSIINTRKKPFIVSDNMLVKFGALAARGIDYKESGKQAAEMAYSILVEGKKPYEIPMTMPHIDTIYINAKTLAMLELVVPEALKKDTIILV
ncbi:MAG TPA: ABC transporter substrate-binding protein [Candidatus Babeliales bacterium]|jgi:putative ABC transport system substrate-binding protein|nr:ABC transporter substrate-binding protein [Candidatus Babeliales bacterium]